MTTSADGSILTDPVCAAQVDPATLHRHVYGGAVFCFCSGRCRALFIADPARYIVLVHTIGKNGRPTRGPPTPPVDPDRSTSEALQLVEASPHAVGPMIDLTEPGPPLATRPTLQLMTIPVWPVQIGDIPADGKPGTVASPLPGSGWRDVLAGLFPWRERRFARQVSRELLKLYGIVAASHPKLRGRDLYRKIVIARTRSDEASAEALLDQAEESFAAWPTRRDLKFVDVVHFVAVSEFLASHGNSPWIYANMGREVESQIPGNL